MRGIGQIKEKTHFRGVGMEGVTVEKVAKLGYDEHAGHRRVEEGWGRPGEWSG